MSVCAIGLWAWTEKDTFNNIGRLTNIALDPAMLFILSGGVMFIIGFAGCVGALRENTCLLMFVSMLILLLLFKDRFVHLIWKLTTSLPSLGKVLFEWMFEGVQISGFEETTKLLSAILSLHQRQSSLLSPRQLSNLIDEVSAFKVTSCQMTYKSVYCCSWRETCSKTNAELKPSSELLASS